MKKARPPIVTVLGHVDHGKTTLLDALRRTNVAAREAGGITQGIGASKVVTQSGFEITFIDTPGHLAFEAMRSRGAQAADIAILVVAADDGVKPQTKEAIEHIRKAGSSYIVAITKTDLASANIESVKGQLEKEGVFLEGRGGDVPVVEVSAKDKKGLNELLEMIELVAQVKGIEADEAGELQAVVIETGKDRRGSLVTVVVREGKLVVGETIKAGNQICKIKALFDDQQKRVDVVSPGQAALILGFGQLPPVGAPVALSDTTQMTNQPVVKDEVRKASEKGEVLILLKAANAGALEALIQNLPEKTRAVSQSIGEINDSDIFLAKASGADIYAFGVKPTVQIKTLAKTEGVSVFSFNVIYELFDQLRERVEAKRIKVLAKAEIINTFPFNNKMIAGCRMLEGEINKNSKLSLLRGEEKVGEIKKILSIKKLREDVEKVSGTEEFGILFIPQLDFQRGDVILSVA